MLKLANGPARPTAPKARHARPASEPQPPTENRLVFPTAAWREVLGHRGQAGTRHAELDAAGTDHGLSELSASIDQTLRRLQAGIDSLNADVDSYKFPVAASASGPANTTPTPRDPSRTPPEPRPAA